MIFGSWKLPVWCWRAGLIWAGLFLPVWADNGAPASRDTLVYKDGDRVQGVLVQQTAEAITFKSDRFGELRVPARDAVVIKGDRQVAAAAVAVAPAPAAAPKPAAPKPGATAAKPAAATTKAAAPSRDAADEERVTVWDRFSPALLTARVRNFFGPWQGRLSVSSEFVSDTADRNNSSYEGRLQRKWKSDEVNFNLRFDYNETNNVATTDLVRSGGLWRHTFTKTVFAHYRPSGEWNRASRLRGVPNDYVLLQQELGAGYHVLTTPSRKFRVGASQNFFDRWTLVAERDHDSRGVISTFQESELALPWRITVSQRGVWYPVTDNAVGWENRVDLNKKLTETLSASLRHEIRRNNPDGTAQDYTRLKLMFGLDF